MKNFGSSLILLSLPLDRLKNLNLKDQLNKSNKRLRRNGSMECVCTWYDEPVKIKSSLKEILVYETYRHLINLSVL